MNAKPWAAGGVHEHWIRPGLHLSWGANLDGTPHPPETTALFRFILGQEADRSADRMLAASPSSATSLAILGEATSRELLFQATLALSSSTLADLLAEDHSPDIPRLRAFFSAPDGPCLPLPLTPAARLAVESIRRCPFVGAIRDMALTARGNDLLVEFLTALSAVELPRPPALLRSITEQVEAAAALLAQRLEDPPSLPELARHVGLSETSLKRGFHQVYATTVFGYLRLRRMERARALLESGDATVLEAAAMVGYSNPSNFASAFRQQFGINPKEFQLAARR